MSIFQIILSLVIFILMILYNLRSYLYSENLLEARGNTVGGMIVSCVANCLLLALDLFAAIPVVLLFLLSFICLLLQFLLFFQGNLPSCLFSSGTFLFHLMNVKMAVSGIFILSFQTTSQAEFRGGILYPCSVLVTLLIVMLFLEIFKIVMGRQKMQILIHNTAQLAFVTTSLSLINVYLMILSVFYESQAYSTLVSLFLLCTALLLFGAFYTSFHHAVRMSILTEYEHKSEALERQLDESNRVMDALRDAALTDTLTSVYNRRYGMLELERLREKRAAFALCFLDIDHLKFVNDRYGHEEGDRYILTVVRVLSECFPPPATVSRMGGDEFLVLLPQCNDIEAVRQLKQAAKQISQLPATYRPTISFGVVESTAEDTRTPEELMKLADARMYRQKQQTKAAASSQGQQ